MRYDVSLRSFLIAMWVIAFVSLVGFEVKYLIFEHNWFVPSLLILAFIVIPIGVRRLLVIDAISRRVSGLPSLSPKLRLQPAHYTVEAWVCERAQALGVRDVVNVLTIPDFSSINGRAVQARSKNFIALSIKAQSLLLSGVAEQIATFRILVDHEIGHLINRDVRLLLLARAILLSAVIFVPLKLLIGILIGPSEILYFYASALPSHVLWVPVGPGASNIAHGRLSTPMVIVALLVLNGGTLFGIWWLYRAINRRRELLADQFAIMHSSDRYQTSVAFHELLAQPKPSVSLPFSFMGSAQWHPALRERLAQLFAPRPRPVADLVGLLVAVSSIAYLRYTLGNERLAPVWGVAAEAMIAGSAAMVGILAYVMTPLSFSTAGKLKDRFQEQARAVVAAIGIACAIAFVIKLLQEGLSVSAQAVMLSAFSDEQALADLESFDRNMLLVSLPIVVGLFAVTYAAFGLLGGNRSPRWLTWIKHPVCIGVALSLTIAVTMACEDAVDRTRADYFVKIQQGLEETVATNCADTMMKESCEAGLRLTATKLEWLPLRIKMDMFSPPLSFLLLWHQPFQGRWV